MAVEYAREGHCSRCGECCHAYIAFVQDTRYPPMGFEQEIVGDPEPHKCSDVWTQVLNGKEVVCFFKIVEIKPDTIECGSLLPDAGDGMLGCALYHDKARLACREWPMSPAHIKQFTHCTYSFKEIARWSFESGIDSVIP